MHRPLTWSRVAVVTKGLHSRLPSQTRGRVVARQDRGAIGGGAPIAVVDTQSAKLTPGLVRGRVFQCCRTLGIGVAVADAAVVTLVPWRTSVTYRVVARSAGVLLK